ncbi:MAG TPA: ATP-binding protein [Polyangia bacterium]|nr:ATP-binding protein [Polyangia bacterium]
MKTVGGIGVILVALAGILGLSISSGLREQERLVDDFTQAARQQAHASVEVLSERLDALDQDTRMLSDLVGQSAGGEAGGSASQRPVWEAAFRALAVVVAQYRTIALVGADGAFEVLAVDPTETGETVAALKPDVRRLAAEVISRRAQALGKPTRIGHRSFLLYGKPVSGGRAIVVASDAAIFLGAVAWTPLQAARLYVTDPAGVVWAGCETAAGCRAQDAGAPLDAAPLSPPALRQMGARGTMVVRPPQIPAVQVSERVDRPTGSWVVTWLASTHPIVERQQSMVARVVLTALAAAIAVAGIGAFMLRQQRKAVELEGRLRYAQALADARQTSQAIVENAPLGVLGVSRDGRVALANGFLTERLGPIRVGEPLAEALPEAEAAPLRDLATLLSRELGSTDAAGASADEQLRFVTTGSHQFQVRIVPVRSHEAGVRTFALVEDQSELRALEHQLVRAEKLITVGVLSAGIAHEIGSPLAVIRGRAEQVLRVLDGGARAEDLRTIIKHIDNITSTIRRVLDFSRRQPIERRAVALGTVVERARALLQWKLDTRHLELIARLDPALPHVAADPDQLEQVLVNLLLNACDASREGGRVAVAARGERGPEGGFLEIDVEDQGCGIAPEHLNAVFDPFFTTKKRGEGTGLGLSIVASVVRNHGGEIHVASALEKGTKVTMRWPVATQPADEELHA